MDISDKDIKRFFAKVDKSDSPDGCWLWKAVCFQNGYGAFRFKGKQMRSHRFSYQLHKGAIPDGLIILHSCDNRKCVNPNHLKAGTQLENQNDMTNKKRGRTGDKNGTHTKPETVSKGSMNGNSKLTESDVIAIRELYKTLQNYSAVGRMFGVSHWTVTQIILRRIWKHIP